MPGAFRVSLNGGNLGLETWPFAFQATCLYLYSKSTRKLEKMSGQLGTKIKVQSDDGAPECMEAEEMGWLWGGKKGTDPQLGGWWCLSRQWENLLGRGRGVGEMTRDLEFMMPLRH